MTSPADSGVVVFNYPEWIVQYPEFAASVTQPVAQSYFDRLTVGGMVDNTPSSIIQDLSQRTTLLNLAVAHLADLSGSLNPSRRGLVGRISDASQGSVSVRTEYSGNMSDTAAWWNQTSYGAQYYAFTLRFRTAFYIPNPNVVPRNSLWSGRLFGRRGF